MTTDPEDILIRRCTSLDRLTRYPHPLRPWLLRRIAELLAAAIELKRMRRMLDRRIADDQADERATAAMARAIRAWSDEHHQ